MKCIVHKCRSKRIAGKAACYYHACRNTSCANGFLLRKPLQSYAYCGKCEIPKCKFKDSKDCMNQCNNYLAENNCHNFCKDHYPYKCCLSDCNNTIYSRYSKYYNLVMSCDDHRCVMCKNIALDNIERKCINHTEKYCKYCYVQNKSIIKCKECIDHKCKYNNCNLYGHLIKSKTGMWVIKSSCYEHLCKHIPCNNYIARNSMFCVFHKCDIECCNKEISRLKLYCEEHLCNYPLCNCSRLLTSDRCQIHSLYCRYELCTNWIFENSIWCNTHHCVDKTCPYDINCYVHKCAFCKISKNSSYHYCKNHKCSAQNCDNFCENNNFCNSCTLDKNFIIFI